MAEKPTKEWMEKQKRFHLDEIERNKGAVAILELMIKNFYAEEVK